MRQYLKLLFIVILIVSPCILCQGNKRNKPKPIRITFGMKSLENDTNQEERDYVDSLFQTIENFIPNLLKVNSPSSINIMNGEKCQKSKGVKIPETDILNGIPNSDLHIYVSIVRQNENFLAEAKTCSNSNNRPNFGIITLNLSKITPQKNRYIYQKNLKTIFHEILHILSPLHSKLKKISENIRGFSTNLLQGPFLLETAKIYFGCPTLKGVQLENQGGETAKDSHWESTVLKDEILTSASQVESIVFSIFSIASLKESKFWAGVNENLAEPFYWGKNKGCDFLENACQSKINYEEFSDMYTEGCNFLENGAGYSSQSKYLDGCYSVSAYLEEFCKDEDQNVYGTIRENDGRVLSFGHESKCFNSNIYLPGKQRFIEKQPTRCLQVKCENNNTLIKITSGKGKEFQFTIECKPGEERMVKRLLHNSIFLGNITCPSNYERFCSNNYCPNNCSYQGICIKGTCYCNKNYSGEGCQHSRESEISYYLPKENRFVKLCSKELFADPSNTCVSKCPTGYYPDSKQICQLCDFSCSECTGSSKKQCTKCQLLTFLINSKCVSKCPPKLPFGYEGVCYKQCPPGTYSHGKRCYKCSSGCLKCQNHSECEECEVSFNLSPNKKCCKKPCLECTGYDPKECEVCENNHNYFQGSCIPQIPENSFRFHEKNRIYKQCAPGCIKCQNESECQECDSKFTQSISKQTCCNPNCGECNIFNSNTCTKCRQGFQLDKKSFSCKNTI